MSLLTNIVSYWKFDENTGSSVGDATGNGNTGTWQGTLGSQWTTGVINSGGNFNGSNNAVKISSSLVSIMGQFSISLWVNCASSADRKMFSIGRSSSATPIIDFTGGGTGNNYFRAYFRNDQGTTLLNGVLSTTQLYNSSWNHFVMTGNNGTCAVYINGSLDATNFNFTPSGTLTVDQSAFGAELIGGSLGGYLQCKIDEAGLWSRAISSTEVSQLYNSGAALQYPFGINPSPITGYVQGNAPQPYINNNIILF